MGKSGFTAFVNSDGGVFAHLHRSGTVPIAAPMANPNDGARSRFGKERYARG
jgi:hypothetical protein